MTGLTYPFKELTTPSYPRTMDHDHDWSDWQDRTKDSFFRPRNWEDGRNRPYIDIVVAEKRWCCKEKCIATEWRNEREVRQYLAIIEEVE